MSHKYTLIWHVELLLNMFPVISSKGHLFLSFHVTFGSISLWILDDLGCFCIAAGWRWSRHHSAGLTQWFLWLTDHKSHVVWALAEVFTNLKMELKWGEESEFEFFSMVKDQSADCRWFGPEFRVCPAGTVSGQHAQSEGVEGGMRTSLRAPLWLLEAAAARGRLGPTKPAGGCGAAPRPGGGLLWSHCALIRSRSWLSSIPVPSSCSAPPPPPAADEEGDAAVANRASQEPARCSCRARAACKTANQTQGWGGRGCKQSKRRNTRQRGEGGG